MSRTMIAIIATEAIDDMIDRIKTALSVGVVLEYCNKEVAYLALGGEKRLYENSSDASYIGRALVLFGVKRSDILENDTASAIGKQLSNRDELYLVADQSTLIRPSPEIECCVNEAESIRYWPTIPVENPKQKLLAKINQQNNSNST